MQQEEIEIGISGIRKLTDLVTKKYDFDIGNFAVTSLKRRIGLIIQKNNLGNLDGLMSVLENTPSFFTTFQFQMTVEGTEIFRDPAFWRFFRDDICKILDRNHQKIKIWIPGCSSGEEVVSTCIMLKEANIYDKCVIYATDLNQEIVSRSRSKVYNNSMLEISENNYKRFQEDESASLSMYYEKKNNGFAFTDTIYPNVVYDIYDGQDEKKLKGVNVIICRNQFIFYTSQYQDKLMGVFTGKLITNGYLAVGNKENITFCSDYKKYVVINESEKIYRKSTP